MSDKQYHSGYEDLFDYLSHNHGLNMLQSEMSDLIHFVHKFHPHPQGAVWVKASVRLPATGLIVWRWQDKTEAYTGYKEKTGFHFGTGGARVDPTYYSEIEWLYEQATKSNKEPEAENIIEFLRWAKANNWHQCIHDEQWLYKPGVYATPTYKTTAELHDIWQQSKKKP